PEATQYRLAVDLAFQKQGVAITQKDVTSRFDVTGTAGRRRRSTGWRSISPSRSRASRSHRRT
ncbi:hypothetical protein CNY89_30380, partial [Amaricoccus sp. HAR-UPW-R2A-40]